MGAMGMETMEDMADTVHMTALTIMGPPLFLTATEMRLPGRELLISSSGAWCPLLVKPYPASDGDRHIRPASVRMWSRTRPIPCVSGGRRAGG